MILSLTFARSLGKVENLGLRPRFSTLPSGPCKCCLGFALGFQHFPRDLANINEWKIVFDPSIKVAELSNCVRNM